MVESGAAGARALLRQFARRLATVSSPGERLAMIPRLVAEYMVAEVCSIYLIRHRDTLELCATEGLNPDAVHRTNLSLDEGLVGRVARTGEAVSTADAPNEPDFRYIPEIGEEPLRSFLGVPIRRPGRTFGVLVVQNRAARTYLEEDYDALALVALVIAEMAETGQILRPAPHRQHYLGVGVPVNAGFAIGTLLRHEPRFVVTQPVAEDPETECSRLHGAISRLRGQVDGLLLAREDDPTGVFDAYRRFAHDRSWLRRMEERIRAGLSAEAAVHEVRAEARARIESAGDTYLRGRLRDLDDLAAQLMRELLGRADDANSGSSLPPNAILVARDLGPGDLLRRDRKAILAVALEEGSANSHAAIVARGFDLPMVVQVADLLQEGENGDTIVVDGDLGRIHVRPTAEVEDSYRDKLAIRREALAGLRALRRLPALTSDGVRVRLMVNAGLLADIPEVEEAGAEGVGLFRTELQFIANRRLPRRDELTSLYRRVLDTASGRPVTFRTLDAGSDKPLPGVRRDGEANPALGWRALRLGLDRPYLLRMQMQALLRAAAGRELRLMFPLVADFAEYRAARTLVAKARDSDQKGTVPGQVVIGAMLETPSLAFAPDEFFREVPFLSVGGNDLLQFFFAADRTNERVRARYDPLHGAFLRFLRSLAARCDTHGVPVSFCGEAAGDPLFALALSALGFRQISMRPASIGHVKQTLRAADLNAATRKLNVLLATGEDVVIRDRFAEFAVSSGWPIS